MVCWNTKMGKSAIKRPHSRYNLLAVFNGSVIV